MSLSHVQTEGSNISMPYSQSIGTSTMRPNIESIATLYGNNQPVNSNL